MQRLSLSARQELAGEISPDTMIALIVMECSVWDAPQRITTHPVKRLSGNPLYYGVMSSALTEAPAEYAYLAVSVILPDKNDEVPAAQIVFAHLDNRMGQELFRITGEVITVSVAAVMAGAPDDVQELYEGLEVVSGPCTEDTITFVSSMASIWDEPCPCDRMTAARFPGLRRG